MPKSRPRPPTRGSRPVAAGLSVLLLAAASACAPVTAAPRPEEGPVVLTTFTVLADIAAVVGGPDVHVESITDVGSEIHGYEPSPDDLRRAAGADLLLVNGLGLETWVEGLVAPLDLPTVVVTTRVEPVPIDPDHPDGPVNPHAWMSPLGGALYVDAVEVALSDLVPEHAGDFARRADAYRARLLDLHTVLVERLETVAPQHRTLATCERAFTYLARDAGLDEVYLWPVNAERQGTPRQVAAAILAVRERELPTVFCESTVSPTAQEQVAREAGAVLGDVLYVDSLSTPDGPVPTYLDLLEHDVDVILAGLGGAA